MAKLEDDADFSVRENRFPSVAERVKLYMSNWYVPPCEGYDDGLIHYQFVRNTGSEWPSLEVHGYQKHPLVNASVVLELESTISPDMIFFMENDIVENCASPFDEKKENNKRQLKLAAKVKFRANMRMYCHDVKGSFLAAWNHIHWEDKD